MPICLLSLPGKDLQYTLKCMGLGDIIGLSLCSKRTKNLVKSSNRKIDPPSVYVHENRIRIDIIADHECILLNIFDFYIILGNRKGTGFLRKEEFTQADWIAHFMSILNGLMVQKLSIDNDQLCFLDTVKRCIPKINKLEISHICSEEFTREAFFKLAPISEEVEVEKNIFDGENDISKCLTLNLNSVWFNDMETPCELELENLLTLNIANLTIRCAIIKGKELNRFLKLWMKGNHTFYRPKYLELFLTNRMNCQEVLREVEHEIVYREHRLKRRDGKELIISFKLRSDNGIRIIKSISFKFS